MGKIYIFSHHFSKVKIESYPHPQAVNKLAEIMNRKEVRGGGSRRGNDTDMRRKEKENRKLQLELRSEKEKLNSTIIKYQKEINEMQAVSEQLGFLSLAVKRHSAAVALTMTLTICYFFSF